MHGYDILDYTYEKEEKRLLADARHVPDVHASVGAARHENGLVARAPLHLWAHGAAAQSVQGHGNSECRVCTVIVRVGEHIRHAVVDMSDDMYALARLHILQRTNNVCWYACVMLPRAG
jgi:hypothetical protein